MLIVAAEASSALYAQRLLEELKKQYPSVHSFGVGSQAMEALGFERIGCSEKMAVVGLQEVLAHWSEISSVFKQLLSEAQKRKPQFALLLDYPDFNLRLAKKLKAQGIRVIYYISPQVWAWRSSRIHQIKKFVDLMLVVFPFEEAFYKKHGVPVRFVGHPLLDELERLKRPENLRERFGIQKEEVLLALMPGSRKSEIKHHLSVQLEVAKRLLRRNQNLKIALLLAPSLSKEDLNPYLKNLDFPLIVMQEEPLKMVSVADIVLTASGTATLIVGLLEKPMVIMYKMNRLTAYLIRRLVRSTPFFGMINLILGKEVVPEFFQEQASVENLEQAIQSYLNDPQKRKQTQEQLKLVKERLGHRGATQRVLDIIGEYL
ncbi:MAG: lipid-A-disaccharide synthase [Bdellovibrio sp.]|nr:MAG: lipid-A-disaccharide synthase [Bdellovibrio sp.]